MGNSNSHSSDTPYAVHTRTRSRPSIRTSYLPPTFSTYTSHSRHTSNASNTNTSHPSTSTSASTSHSNSSSTATSPIEMSSRPPSSTHTSSGSASSSSSSSSSPTAAMPSVGLSPPIRIGYPYYEEVARGAELAKARTSRRRKLRESFSEGLRPGR